MDATITDQATAIAALIKTRDVLAVTAAAYEEANAHLRGLIFSVRPKGLLTVDEMAKAIERDRNYIDSVWSLLGGGVKVDGKVKQTRVPVAEGADAAAARQAYNDLADASRTRQLALSAMETARAERNRVITMIYAADMPGLGPSPIARHVGIDRNHVLRIVRRAGVKPVHRTGAKNQYTSTAG